MDQAAIDEFEPHHDASPVLMRAEQEGCCPFALAEVLESPRKTDNSASGDTSCARLVESAAILARRMSNARAV